MSRYREKGLKAICSKLSIEELWLNRGSDEEVRELKEKATKVKSGEVFWFNHLQPVMQSTWQVTRVPYLLEWEHKCVIGDKETLIHFDNISEFDAEDHVSLSTYVCSVNNELGRNCQLERVKGIVK